MGRGEGEGADPGGSEASRSALAGLSTLLADLARTPERELQEAWARGPRPGDVVGRFELVRELGRGGFGVVFEARDRELERSVAFKVIRPGRREQAPMRAELLQREAAAIAQLSHPNIVTLYDAGRCESGPYLVLELLHGEPLDRRISRGPLAPAEALAIATGVARALVHAHARGVLHRDLKPGNVILAAGGTPKVLDFGLAHVFGRESPRGAGTPGYMAPEQRRGEEEDARADVWAVGVLLWEMLSGRRLGEEDFVEGQGEPPRPAGPGIPTALSDLVARCLSMDAAARPASAAELCGALEGIALGAARGMRVRRLLAAALAAAAVAGATGWWLRVRVDVRRAARSAAVAPVKPPTADVEAWRHYFLGEQCAARPVYGQDCGPHFRAAAARDPAFALAHYELALWSFWFGGPRAEQLDAIAKAVAHAADTPEKEQRMIRAWDAYLHGREQETTGILREVTARWPQDRAGWFMMGDVLRRREELSAAIPWFEKAAEVDPDYGWALAHLAECLGATGDEAGLRRWVARWEERAHLPELHALVIAYGWLGDATAAEGAAKRAVALGGGVSAREDLLAVWTMQGRYAEVQAAVRALAKPGSEIRPMGYFALAAMEAYRGRRAAGFAVLEAMPKVLPAVTRESLYRNARIEYLLGDRDLARVRRELAAIAQTDPAAAAEHAAEVAWLGDAALGAKLADGLRPDSPLRRAHDAVARFRRGEVDAGLADLRALAAASPVFTWRVAPVYLYGDLAAEAGRCAEAREAFARFQRTWQPIAMWRSWALPRSRTLAAACEKGAKR